jgi:hypothetical protein
MDMGFKQRFLDLWNAYFSGAELPIVFYFTNEERHGGRVKPPKEDFRCVFQDLAMVRRGKPRSLNINTIGCEGGKAFLGFLKNPAETQGPRLRQILHQGIPGKVRVEKCKDLTLGRYKKSSELLDALVKPDVFLPVLTTNIVFKRWDTLDKEEEPMVVIFFASADVLSGLFALANFDEADVNAVIAPYTSGCGSIVTFPYNQLQSPSPKAVLGMFDIMPRRYIPPGKLTFAVPWPKFVRMVNNFEESFLITEHWQKLEPRIKRNAKAMRN